MVDRNLSPNAESLNFVVRADAVLDPERWNFSGQGRRRLEEFLKAEANRKQIELPSQGDNGHANN